MSWPPPKPGQALTRRERQVLGRLLAGRSEKQVALDVGISEHTVANYRKSLHVKLAAESRGELLALFVVPSDAVDAIVASRLATLTPTE